MGGGDVLGKPWSLLVGVGGVVVRESVRVVLPDGLKREMRQFFIRGAK